MIFVYLIFYYLFLFFYGVHFLSIGNIEMKVLNADSFVSSINHLFFYLFGKSDITLRLPSFIASIISLILYYYISIKVLKNKKDVYMSVILFTLLPGFIISTILVNKSIYLILFTLLFVYLFLYKRFLSYIVLSLFVFLDYSFVALYFGLFFYALYKKQNLLIIYSLILFMLNANYFHYSIGGIPKGEFLNLLVVYFAIFSPLLFIYFLYSIYKYLIKNQKNILWFISFSAFFVSILLSFRQRIRIDDFAPYVVISSIFMVKTFLESYRVRLRVFRKPYKIMFILILSSVVLFDFVMFDNKFLYKFCEKPQKHLMYNFYNTKKIVSILKNKKIDKVFCEDKMLCKKLYFYGVTKGNKFFISNHKISDAEKISIYYQNMAVKTIYVSKVNTYKQ